MLIFQSSREQLAIAEFARSLLVIPKTLAVNAAQDATDLVAKLRAFHNSSQTKAEHASFKWLVIFPILFFLCCFKVQKKEIKYILKNTIDWQNKRRLIFKRSVSNFRMGLDLYEGSVKNNLQAGVLEPAISKVKSLKFATEAAITILRIDDMIRLDPKQEGGRSYEDACNAGDLDG